VKRLLAVLMLGLLGACAGPDIKRAPDDAAVAARRSEHAARAAAFDPWRLVGRIAVQRGDKGVSADLRWHQAGDAFDLRVMAPLNGGTFALQGDATQVAMITPEGETHTAADPAALMQAHLGWSIPVAGARYWVRGLPDPRSTAAQEVFDTAGRWSDFAQDGWRISILEYRAVDGLDLPRRLYLARDDLEVRLVVREWARP
jgi:outer membrane lipoprotein LolB